MKARIAVLVTSIGLVLLGSACEAKLNAADRDAANELAANSTAGLKEPEVQREPWKAYVKDDNVYVTTGDGDTVQLTFVGRDSRPLISPDKTTVFFVRKVSPPNENDSGDLAIMQVDIASMRESKLADKIHHEEWNETSGFPFVHGFCLSRSGQFIFFMTQKWAVSDALVRLDTKTRALTVISGADSFELIREGRHEGKLIVLRSQTRGDEGRTWSYWLLDADGNAIEEICDEEDEEALKSFKARNIDL